MKTFPPIGLLLCGLLLAACGGTAAPASSPTAPSSPPAKPSASAASEAKPVASAAAKPVASGPASAKPAASGSASAKPAPSVPPGKLGVAYSNITGNNLAAWAAQEGGFFQKNGLDVELQLIAGGSKTMAALLSGQTTFALVGGSEAVSAVSSGADLVVLGTLAPVYPYKFEVAKDIKTAADLKGKKVGVASIGGSADIATRVVLRRLGLDPDKDVTILALGDLQTRSAALLNGAVQAGMDSVPGTLKLEAAGLHPLVNLAAEHIPAANDSVSVPRAWLNANRPVAQKFIDSVVQGTAEVKKDKALGVKILKKYYKSEDDAVMTAVYDFSAGDVMPPLPYAKPDQFKDAIEQLATRNDKLKNFDVSKMLDDSFVKSAADRGLDK